jgi:hypothetical protein
MLRISAGRKNYLRFIPPEQNETQAHPQHCPETGHASNHWHPHQPEQQAGGRSKARTYNNFGQTETHRLTVIELKPEDRAALQAIAKRYRVKSLTRFLECCSAAEDRKGSEQVLFRIYED